MFFKVNKNELVRTLEVILETQQTEECDYSQGETVYSRAVSMLTTINRLPLEFVTVNLSEDEAMFIAEFY